MFSRRLTESLIPIAILFVAAPAAAAVVEAVPLTPIVAPFPAGVPAVETQVVLQLVVDARGGGGVGGRGVARAT